jgi:hypothetical protein
LDIEWRMANVRQIDFLLLDDIFDMGQGYVLNFSDRTMSQFFANELNIDIDDPLYRQSGTSKAKRLRCFLQSVDAATAARTLEALWEYREALRQRSGRDDDVPNAQGRLLELINRIQGGPSSVAEPVAPAFDRANLLKLSSEFAALANLPPQERGYSFEKFLKTIFTFYGLEARGAFRLVGEQIDGSFVLGSETYLLEAKWQNAQTSIGDLRAFHGKVDEKAAWARGLFVSYAGFSPDALFAFGRGKRVICMDGLDLHDALSREIPINHVLERKVRRAAETGQSMSPVRELFP